MTVRRSPSVLALAVCSAVAVLISGGVWTRAAELAPIPGEVRALWVTRATLSNPAAIAQMVATAQSGGFNTLIVQVRARGDAYYRSTIEPRAPELAARPDFDPLAETLALAHRAGLKVHAWVVLNLVSSALELPASRQHVIYRQPEWLMVPRDLAADIRATDPRSPEYVGRIARWTRARSNDVEGLYLSPVSTAAAAYLASIVTEIATTYPVDGIHLDYARFPSRWFDYSPAAVQQFKQTLRSSISDADRRRADTQETLDPLAYPNLFAADWDTFRRSRVTSLVMRIRTAIKTARPGVTLSAAVIPHLEQASNERLQDWRTWLDQGLIDVLCPMVYTPDFALFEEQLAIAQDLAGDRPVWAGVGAYRLTPQATLDRIAAARRLKVGGVILFSYESLVTPPNSLATLADLARAAFGTGSSRD